MNNANNGLVDIKSVSVDRSVSGGERVVEYVRQIKNPYRYICGKYTIIARFAENGPPLEDCLRRLVSR